MTMRMENCRTRLARLAAAGILTISGAAFADVPDGRWTIVADKAPDSSAELELDGDTYSVEIVAVCEEFRDEDSDKGAEIQIATEHPDAIDLGNDKGQVEQSRTGNAASVTFVTGSGENQVTNQLVCEKAEVDADVKTKKTPNTGSFESTGRECSCPELEGNECSDFVEQIGILAAKCQRNQSVDVRFSDENQNLRKFTVKGKGEATREDDEAVEN